MAQLLVITAFLPMIGSLALFLAPRLEVKTARTIALGTVLLTLVFSLILLANFKAGELAPQFAFSSADGKFGLSWLGTPDIRFSLGLDGLSIWLFVLTSVLMIPAIFASWESIQERAALHYAFLLMLQTGLLGLFASLDVVLFYIFFEFSLIPLFFLIGLWGGSERRQASVTFFLYTLAGSLLTLLGVIALVAIHYQHSPSHTLTFSIPELTRGLATLPWVDWHKTTPWTASPQVLIFLLLFAGFAIKVPMFPFHTWLPLAHVEAPAAGSILLAGVLLKVGSYGLLRFNLGMTPIGAQVLFPMLATLSVIGIIYGALVALAQTDIKRLVAYSSVSHMGFIVLGIFSLNPTGMDGAVIQMINHGITTGALFACVGVIYERYHTREMAELGGLWERLPLLAFFLIMASLGSAAVPGLNGFVGEFPILAGTFAASPLAAALAATGMVLGAYYLFLMLQRVIFGPLHEPHHDHESSHDHGVVATVDHGHGHGASTVAPLGWHEIAGLGTLMVLIVMIGVYPRPFLERIRPAVAPIAALVSKEKPDKLADSKVPPQPPGQVSSVQQGSFSITQLPSKGSR
ncbi:complex I subunit 4 family protein [Singulisphaera sp. PoT]|uniref:complex I subunit 4 family protein n=1 Tax=Singulisphaera sp. PoT TaxID=3411797 RepID=UPI003BF4755B